MKVLLLQDIETAAQNFKESVQRDANRCMRRHNYQGALAALEAIEYIGKFLYELRLHAGTQRDLPRFPMIEQRDAEWTRTVLEITDKILTPAQGAKWLARDRELRARHVSDARVRRGPVRW